MPDVATTLLNEFSRFLQVCGEVGKAGRPMDLIDLPDWNRAVLACVSARAQLEESQSADPAIRELQLDELEMQGAEMKRVAW